MGKRHTTKRQARGDQGIFTVSLDFELYWGVRDKTDLESYKANLLGARNVIPQLLEHFAKAGVHATWATVGFLFFDDKDELLAHLPPTRPRYRDQNLSPYDHVLRIGPNERQDPFHYARSLIRRILQFPGQEIGSHTFSHYYCLEEGQTVDEFRADLRAAHRAAQQLGIDLKSLVFPRNQWRPEYLTACAEAGIRVVRGPRQSWMYQPKAGADTAVKRAFRLADAYVSLSGHNASRPTPCEAGLVTVPSSRFLRPFSPRLARLRPLLLHRIRAGMRHAASNGLTYHLWWHPHNFGIHQEQNLDILHRILHYFGQLAQEHGMVSRSMGELVAQDDPAEDGVRARGWSREPELGSAAGGAIMPFSGGSAASCVPGRRTMDAAAVLMGDIVRGAHRQAGPRSLPTVTVQSSRALTTGGAAREDEVVVLNRNDSEYYGSNGIDALIKQPVGHPKESLRFTV